MVVVVVCEVGRGLSVVRSTVGVVEIEDACGGDIEGVAVSGNGKK